MASSPMWTRDEVRRAMEMRKAGMTAAEIGPRVGHTEQQVRDKTRRLGIKLSREQRTAINHRCGLANANRGHAFDGSGPDMSEAARAMLMREINAQFVATYKSAAARNGWHVRKVEGVAA